MNLKNVIIIFIMLNSLNGFGQDSEKNLKLKQELIEKYIINSSKENKEPTDSLILGQYSNDIIGGTYSNLTIYPNSIYKFEYIGEIYSYYDIGKYNFRKGVIQLSSLLQNLSDSSNLNYHNKIIDLTGAQFSFDEFSTNKKEVYHRFISFGKTTDGLLLENNGRREWIKLKCTTTTHKHNKE